MVEILVLILIQYGEGKLALVKKFSNLTGSISITMINSTSCSLAIYMLFFPQRGQDWVLTELFRALSEVSDKTTPLAAFALTVFAIKLLTES